MTNLPTVNHQVLYLTGPPAAGKSTLISALKRKIPSLEVFSYSKELSKYESSKSDIMIDEDGLRAQSAQLVTPGDVSAVDQMLIDFVRDRRDLVPVIIDSHAVTKERYGFRVTPFSRTLLERLSPTAIFMLYTEPQVVIQRIQANSQGRPLVSIFEAQFHCDIQASIAASYAFYLGIPIYYLDSDREVDSLVDEIIHRL